MPVKYPTVEEVVQAFAEAVPSGQPFDQQRWDMLHAAASAMDSTWQRAGDGIKVRQANGARLVRISWQFAIDKMDTSSEAHLCSSTAILRQQMSALVNGEPTSFETPTHETEEGPAAVVKCWTRGIIT